MSKKISAKTLTALYPDNKFAGIRRTLAKVARNVERSQVETNLAIDAYDKTWNAQLKLMNLIGKEVGGYKDAKKGGFEGGIVKYLTTSPERQKAYITKGITGEDFNVPKGKQQEDTKEANTITNVITGNTEDEDSKSDSKVLIKDVEKKGLIGKLQRKIAGGKTGYKDILMEKPEHPTVPVSEETEFLDEDVVVQDTDFTKLSDWKAPPPAPPPSAPSGLSDKDIDAILESDWSGDYEAPSPFSRAGKEFMGYLENHGFNIDDIDSMEEVDLDKLYVKFLNPEPLSSSKDSSSQAVPPSESKINKNINLPTLDEVIDRKAEIQDTLSNGNVSTLKQEELNNQMNNIDEILKDMDGINEGLDFEDDFYNISYESPDSTGRGY